MRWRLWRPEPAPEPACWSGPPARLPDSTDQSEPAVHGGAWLDPIPGHPVPPAVDEPTAQYPIVTPGQRLRSEGGGWRR